VNQHLNAESQQLLLRRIRDLPSLPEVVDQIVHLMAQPNTPASDIAKLIAYDPGLTSKVLRMVNSAAYGLQRQITSIQHGIMLLGFNTVRGLVLSASILKLFENESAQTTLNFRAFWTHSVLTGLTAKVITQTLKIPQTDDAFSAGMLHDIGKMVMSLYLKPQYPAVLAHAKTYNMPCHGQGFVQLERDQLGLDHPDVGKLVAQKWKLPVPITEAIGFHHQPDLAYSCSNLVYAVALANALTPAWVDDTTGNILAQDRLTLPPNIDPELLNHFELDAARFDTILTALRQELDDSQDILASVTDSTSAT
jgi:HD-like signal output (HDOD) protein